MIDLSEMQKMSEDWASEVADIKDTIDGFQILNQEMADMAREAMSDMDAKLKMLEDTRTKVTKPLLNAKRQVDAWFKPSKEALEYSLKTIRKRIGAWTVEQRNESQRLLAEASKASPKKAAQLVAKSNSISAQAPTVREVWKFEIVDAAKVPRDYLAVNDKAIGAVVRSQKGNIEIPGVRIYCEHIAVVS